VFLFVLALFLVLKEKDSEVEGMRKRESWGGRGGGRKKKMGTKGGIRSFIDSADRT